MNYLQRYDSVVRSKCEVLTPSQQLRSGFRTMGDIRKASATIVNPANKSAFGRATLKDIPIDEVEKLLIAGASKHPSGIRHTKINLPPNIPNRPMNIQGNLDFDYPDTPASSIYSSPPESVVSEEVSEYIDLYEKGEISEEELVGGIGLIQDSAYIGEPSSSRGGRREGAGRPSRAEEEIRAMTGQTPGSQRREAGEAIDELLEGAIQDIEEEGSYEPPAYTPPLRRDINRERFARMAEREEQQPQQTRSHPPRREVVRQEQESP